MQETLYQSELKSLSLLNRGKVRDIYAVGKDHLLIVATDRISAFDVVLPNAIPGKGAVLTSVSNFWFERMRGQVANHLSDKTLSDVLTEEEVAQVSGRASLVKKLAPLPIEAREVC